jgi:hypothetical protein
MKLSDNAQEIAESRYFRILFQAAGYSETQEN